MAERELVTIALGNYSTLVAAQWANGTSRYDTLQRTLYTDRSSGAVRGGTGEMQQSTGATRRVPRLVLLDAPHATKLKTLPKLPQCQEGNEEHAFGETGFPVLEEEEEDEEKMHSGTVHQDPHAGDMSMSLKAIKQELFSEENVLVPWWRYISSGVSEDSLHILHPLHRMGGTDDDLSLLHSFGFGLSQLRSTTSSDITGVMESLRRQIEDADSLQGVQCFVDGDSVFGGAACNVMQELWEDAGNKIPAVFFTCFQPLPDEVVALESEIEFADRRKDELCLNRLLATTHMSRHDTAVYVPLELDHWKTSFAGALPSDKAPAWLDNDTATAQLVAAFADCSLYGTRDTGVMSTSGSCPAFYMRDWHAAVRPIRSMRVAAALAAFPLHVHDESLHQKDFWKFLQRYPLLPLCSMGGGSFASLTHATSVDPQSEAGHVLGHAVTFRGAGKLQDLTYPRQEALLRYALPLRTGNYLPLVSDNGYPISRTFPENFVIPKELLSSRALECMDVGTHVVSTYGSAPMLCHVVAQAQKVLRRRRHLYEKTYDIDADEWMEVMEEALQIRDDYDHRDVDDGDNETNDYDNV